LDTDSALFCFLFVHSLVYCWDIVEFLRKRNKLLDVLMRRSERRSERRMVYICVMRWGDGMLGGMWHGMDEATDRNASCSEVGSLGGDTL